MGKESLIERLRNPKKFQKQTAPATQQTPHEPAEENNNLAVIIGVIALVLVAASLLFLKAAQDRAENVSSFLDTATLNGLVVDRTFTPQTNTRYVEISEGADRNVVVEQSGATLPVISRYNFRALTPKNYEIIGVAPWALSLNISSNLNDPELLRYLFNQDAMSKAFLGRKEVAALVENPTALAQAVSDENKVRAFFADDTAQKILASQELADALVGSRFFAYFLISKSGQYYRANPDQAARLINASPTLRALKQNPVVRKAVSENRYLKNIAPTLLK